MDEVRNPMTLDELDFVAREFIDIFADKQLQLREISYILHKLEDFFTAKTVRNFIQELERRDQELSQLNQMPVRFPENADI